MACKTGSAFSFVAQCTFFLRKNILFSMFSHLPVPLVFQIVDSIELEKNLTNTGLGRKVSLSFLNASFGYI